MSLSQTPRKLALKPRGRSLLSEKLTVKTIHSASCLLIKNKLQLEPIRIDERVDNEEM